MKIAFRMGNAFGHPVGFFLSNDSDNHVKVMLFMPKSRTAATLARVRNKLAMPVVVIISLLLTLNAGLYTGSAVSIPPANPPGSLDLGFDPTRGGQWISLSGGWCGIAYDVTIQEDGKVLVGGSFAGAGGRPRSGVVRLHPDGTTDLSFQPGLGVAGTVYYLQLQADGKLLVGGEFTAVDGQPRRNLARLNLDGHLDAGFTAAVSDAVRTIALQADGKILVGGLFTNVNGVDRCALARLHPDGSLDASFDPGWRTNEQVAEINVLVPLAQGKILVAGQGGKLPRGLLQLDQDGTQSPSFQAAISPQPEHGTLMVRAAALTTDGKIVIGGKFLMTARPSQANVARLNPDGSLDPSFDPGSGVDNWGVDAIAVQPDGKILCGGKFTKVAGADRHSLVRFRADGQLDDDFDAHSVISSQFPVVRRIVVRPDQQLVIAGAWWIKGDANAADQSIIIARLTNAGGLDGGSSRFFSGKAAWCARWSPKPTGGLSSEVTLPEWRNHHKKD